MDGSVASAQHLDATSRRSFPVDDYTPHGYLALPTHVSRLRPVGVVRSWDAGVRWHVPAFAGGYGGRRETYRAGVRLGLEGTLAMEALDEAVSRYHTGSLLELDLTHGPARARVAYHTVGEGGLRGQVLRLEGATRLVLHVSYERLLRADGSWGESGLVGRVVDDLVVLQGFEDGEAVVLWTSVSPVDIGITPDATEVAEWARTGTQAPPPGTFRTVLAGPDERVQLHALVGLPPHERPEWLLARGRTLDHAMAELARAREVAKQEERRLVALDDDFWSRAPRLTGDWPAHWRRGLVYDLETVRMMVRPPIGIYHHAWDGMQLQAPRVVLAEAAMDALVLGWADPRLAQELLLGTFLDAPAPNVPCSREDGSYNMVAADGTVCGTSPAWGYPVLVASLLDAMAPEGDWVARLYPALARYIRWWLAERRDDAGFAVYACSWESGQDLSPRFGDQPLGGGHPTRHIRAVDLEAALAHAAGVLADFAERLALHEEAGSWRAEATKATTHLARLWDGSHWSDVDATTGASTGVDDVMLAAPLALGVAPADQHAVAVTGPWLDGLLGEVPVWPMFAWTGVEALRAAGRRDASGALATAVIERAWRFRDARRADPALPLPGICAEYWPEHGRGGGEGYGWGAFTTHLLLSTILGIRPAAADLVMTPWLPEAWRAPGGEYGLVMTIRGRRRRMTIRPLGDDGVEVEIDGSRTKARWGDPIALPAA